MLDADMSSEVVVNCCESKCDGAATTGLAVRRTDAVMGNRARATGTVVPESSHSVWQTDLVAMDVGRTPDSYSE